MSRLVVTIDPTDGAGALYLDGLLVHDFYAVDPFRGSLGIDNQWRTALETLAERLGWDFDVESRHILAREIRGFDYTEWDGYWPDRLEDAPVPTPEELGFPEGYSAE